MNHFATSFTRSKVNKVYQLCVFSVNNIHPTVNPSHSNVAHSEVPPGAPAPVPRVSREPRLNNTYMSHSSSGHPTTLENGLPPDPSPPAAASLSQYQLRGSLVTPQPSPTIR